MRQVERDVETAAYDVERAVGCALRTVFWIFFVVYGAVLGVAGWALYTYVLVQHPINLSNNHKDALIVGLAVVVLGTILAAMTRDQLIHVIFRRVRGRKK
jgi:Mn2+/Fe2+ NRAMP family transporter